MTRVDIRCGDAREVLRSIPEKSVHVAVSSPPYFGLRDYGSPPKVWGGDPSCDHEWGTLGRPHHPGQVEQSKWKTAEAAGKGQTAGSGRFCQKCYAWLGAFGLEPTPALYVAHAVEIFRELRRVLRDDGSFWLNIGDSYAGGGNGGGGVGRGGLDDDVDKNRQADWKRGGRTPPGLKSGDLIGIPWMVATALRDDGWYFRGDVVWAKANAMPESIRGTRWERHRIKVKSAPPATDDYGALAHETVRRARVYNPEIGGQQYVGTEWEPCPGCTKCTPNGGLVLRRGAWRPTRAHEMIFQFSKTAKYYSDGEAVLEEAVSGAKGSTFTKGKTAVNGGDRLGQGPRDYDSPTRNKRSVWSFASQPFKEAHFAVFPPALVEPCILSSTSEHGVCATCGAPFARIVERTAMVVRPSERREEAHAAGAGSGRTVISGTMVEPARSQTVGWKKTCACPGKRAVPATVLDPFNGAGTTGYVAVPLGRNYIGIDINPDYVEMSKRRIGKRLYKEGLKALSQEMSKREDVA